MEVLEFIDKLPGWMLVLAGMIITMLLLMICVYVENSIDGETQGGD